MALHLVTTFLLIRHASHDLLGRALAGRAPEVYLNERGRHEAGQLERRLAQIRLSALYSSPSERARETVRPLAARRSLEIREHCGVAEIDFGEWTRRTFAELALDPRWNVWVHQRSRARPPGGEGIVDVQSRAVAAIHEIASAHPEECVAIVSHGDVIKSIIAWALESSLDTLECFDIAPASISELAVDHEWKQVRFLNDTGSIPSV